jgi:hypothetical protein
MPPGRTRTRVTLALLVLTAGLGVINLRLAYENRAAERLSLSLERQIAEAHAPHRVVLDTWCTSLEPLGRTASRQTLLEAVRRANPADALYLVLVEGCAGTRKVPGLLTGKLRSAGPQSTSSETSICTG